MAKKKNTEIEDKEIDLDLDNNLLEDDVVIEDENEAEGLKSDNTVDEDEPLAIKGTVRKSAVKTIPAKKEEYSSKSMELETVAIPVTENEGKEQLKITADFRNLFIAGARYSGKKGQIKIVSKTVGAILKKSNLAY